MDTSDKFRCDRRFLAAGREEIQPPQVANPNIATTKAIERIVCPTPRFIDPEIMVIVPLCLVTTSNSRLISPFPLPKKLAGRGRIVWPIRN